MKVLKRFLLLSLAVTMTIFLSGCGNKEVEGSLEDIMTKIYEGVKDDEKPMMLENFIPEKDNIEYYIGTKDIDYKEILVSESQIGSTAHSVVLLRLNDNADVEEAKTKIKETVQPNKWICVEAEKVVVKNKGHLIVLIMSSNETATKIETNFDNL